MTTRHLPPNPGRSPGRVTPQQLAGQFPAWHIWQSIGDGMSPGHWYATCRSLRNLDDPRVPRTLEDPTLGGLATQLTRWQTDIDTWHGQERP